MPSKKTSKEEIIVQAFQVFRKKGFYHTSIGDLAKVCGIPKSHFYYYFSGGKEELMGEVLRSVHDYFSERVFPLAYDDLLPPPQRWEKIQDRLERMFLGDKGGCIMAMTSLEMTHLEVQPEFMDLVRSYFEELIETFTYLFQQYLKSDQAKEMAERAVQDLEGGIVLYQLFKEEKYILDPLRRVSLFFQNGKTFQH